MQAHRSWDSETYEFIRKLLWAACQSSSSYPLYSYYFSLFLLSMQVRQDLLLKRCDLLIVMSPLRFCDAYCVETIHVNCGRWKSLWSLSALAELVTNISLSSRVTSPGTACQGGVCISHLWQSRAYQSWRGCGYRKWRSTASIRTTTWAARSPSLKVCVCVCVREILILRHEKEDETKKEERYAVCVCLTDRKSVV